MNEVRVGPFATNPQELLQVTWRLRTGPLVRFFLAFATLCALFLAVSTQSFLMLLAIIPLFGIFMLMARFVTLPQQIRKVDRLVFTDREIVMDMETISWTFTEGLHSRVPWKLVRKAASLNDIYVLTLPGGNVLMLPRRVMDNDQEHFLVDRLREVKLLP